MQIRFYIISDEFHYSYHHIISYHIIFIIIIAKFSNKLCLVHFSELFNENKKASLHLSGEDINSVAKNYIKIPTNVTEILFEHSDNEEHIEPLSWYAGFQPILLTLPENKTIKTINWLALRDHRKKVS